MYRSGCSRPARGCSSSRPGLSQRGTSSGATGGGAGDDAAALAAALAASLRDADAREPSGFPAASDVNIDQAEGRNAMPEAAKALDPCEQRAEAGSGEERAALSKPTAAPVGDPAAGDDVVPVAAAAAGGSVGLDASKGGDPSFTAARPPPSRRKVMVIFMGSRQAHWVRACVDVDM